MCNQLLATNNTNMAKNVANKTNTALTNSCSIIKITESTISVNNLKLRGGNMEMKLT